MSALFTVVTVRGVSAYIKGKQAKALIVEAGGRGVWSRQHRAWATTSRVAADVLAICDRRSLPVAYSNASEVADG